MVIVINLEDFLVKFNVDIFINVGSRFFYICELF